MSPRERNTAEYQSLLAEERLVVEATEAVHEAMDRQGTNKRQLAERLGVKPSEISQRLSGRRNLTLRSFAAMLDVLGVRAKILVESKDTPFRPGARWNAVATSTQSTLSVATMFNVNIVKMIAQQPFSVDVRRTDGLWNLSSIDLVGHSIEIGTPSNFAWKPTESAGITKELVMPTEQS